MRGGNRREGLQNVKGRSRIVLRWAGWDGESTNKGVSDTVPEVLLDIVDICRWIGSSSSVKRRKTDMMEL